MSTYLGGVLLCALMATFSTVSFAQNAGLNFNTQATAIKVDPSSGSANLPINIEVPPGRGGIEPNISLVYSSSNRQLGIAGVGWGFDLGSVVISTKKGVPNYNSTDTYMLSSGQQLIFDSTVGFYRMEVEGAFSKIEKRATDWVITDKKGVKYFYGSTDDSRQYDPSNSSKVYRWALNKVIDVFGNAMNVYYRRDNAQIYPDRIEYTAVEGVNASLVSGTPASVKFEYQAARRFTTSYGSGFLVKNRLILSAIKTYGPQNALQLTYNFGYSESSATRRDLLTSVRVDGAGVSTPSLTFRYDTAKGFTNKSVTLYYNEGLIFVRNNNGTAEDDGVRPVDFNSDGYTEFIKIRDYCPNVLESRFYPNMNRPVADNWNVYGIGAIMRCQSTNKDQGVRFADVNGDGRMDAVKSMAKQNGEIVRQTLLNPGAPGDFINSTDWLMPHVFAHDVASNSGPQGGVLLADINGDSFTDIIAGKLSFHSKRETLINKLASGSSNKGWESMPSYMPPEEVDFTNGWVLLDLNGDGLPDLYKQVQGETRVYFNTGKGWVLDTDTDFAHPTNWDIRNGNIQFTDLNGDGLVDKIIATNGARGTHINGGNGWYEDAAWALPEPVDFLTGNTQFADINADGVTDYITASSWDGARVFINNAKPADLLVEVNNGLSTTAAIEYDFSARYTNQFMPFTMPVVKSLSLTSMSKTYTTRYVYEGGYWDATDREFRGFSKVTTFDPDNNYTVSHFVTDDHFKKGLMKEQIVYDSTGKILQRAVNSYTATSMVGGKVQFVTLARSDKYDYGQAGDLKLRSAQTFEYDSTTGEPTKKINYGSIDLSASGTVSLDNNVLTTTLAYVSKSDNNLAVLPKYVHVQDKAGNYIKKTWFYYDNATDNSALFTRGLLTKKEEWAGDGQTAITTTYAYDALGNLTSTTDAKGKTTSITYDSVYKMFPIKTTNALNQNVKTVYYSINESEVNADPQYNAGLRGLFGQVMAVIDANGQKVFKHYDGLGRMLKVYGPFDSFSLPTNESIYSTGANFIKVHLKSRIKSGDTPVLETIDFFDGLGRLIQSKKRSAQSGSYIVAGQKVYNNRSLVEKEFVPQLTANDLNVIESTPSNSVPNTTNTYDPLGRLIKTVNKDGTYSNIVYDGLSTKVYDANGHMSETRYDSFNRMASRIEYKGADGRDSRYPAAAYQTYATTTYQYDASGNLTSVTDAKGNTTTMTYDKLGRKTAMNDVDMHVWNYTYDANGNLLTQTDANNKTLRFEYDDLNRLTSKTDAPVNTTPTALNLYATYTYDDPLESFSQGRLTKAVSIGEPTTQFNYDQIGREISSSKTINSTTYWVNRQFDALNRITNLKYPDNSTITYTYNDAGQISLVSALSADGATTTTLASEILYNALGQITKITFGNGAITQNSYDPTNFRLIKIVTTDSTSAKVQDFTYTYDSVGNILSITDAVHTGSQTFQYDDLNRLTRAQGSYGTKVYAYDEIGNITYKDGYSYYYGSNGAGKHAVTSTSDGTYYKYDPNGNMIEKSNGAKGKWTYVYDAENRLKNIGFAPIGKVAKTISEYVYDGDGGRIKKVVYRYLDPAYNNSETYGFLVTQIGAPTFSGNADTITEVTQYVGNLYEIDTTDSIDKRKTANVYIGSTRLAAITGSEINYYHGDHLGSVNVTTDKTGAKRSLTQYDPFGKICRFERYGSKIKSGWQGFNDKQLDDESGLLFYGGRYYDPKLGRFMTADTFVPYASDPQSLNRYSYCRNNPVNLVDPSGHIFFALIGAIISAVSSAISAAAAVVSAIGAYAVAHPFIASAAFSLINTGIGVANGSISSFGAGVTQFCIGFASNLIGFQVGIGVTNLVGGPLASAVGQSAGQFLAGAAGTVVGAAAITVSSGVANVVAEGGSLSEGLSAALKAAPSVMATSAGIYVATFGLVKVADVINRANAAKLSVGVNGSGKSHQSGALTPNKSSDVSGDQALRNRGQVSVRIISGVEDPVLNSPNFVADSSGQVFPVPNGAKGPVSVINNSGKQTGIAFTGGNGGQNGQVSTIRIMNSRSAIGNSPAYPNGYVVYGNNANPMQNVNPYTGRTGQPEEVHYPLNK